MCMYLYNVNMCFIYGADLIYIKIGKKAEKGVERSIGKRNRKTYKI